MKKILLVTSALSILILAGCSPDGPEPEVIDPVQLAEDQGIIETYLTENQIETETHGTGIRYVINAQGIGDSPVLGDRIALKFIGTDLEGDTLVFDTLGVTINLTEIIVNSWVLLLPEISEGGSITIYSPSGYAYGPNGNTFVDPDEIVVFNLELLAIIDDEDEQLDVDRAIIDEYLSESNISVQVHESGIRYIVLEEGTGDSPSSTDVVSVTYEGTFLDGLFFDGSDKPVPFDLSGLIPAWQIMIPQMKKGGKMKIYSPSQFCYGTTGNGIIPPYSILVFEIGLEEIQ